MTDYVTMGMVTVSGRFHKPIFTLENPWLDNKQFMSCIPVGTYHCVPYSGTKYKGVYKVLNVPDRKDILIHWGNWEKDTMGCILLGFGAGMLSRKPAVTNSKIAVKYFKDVLDYQPFDLVIEE